MYEVIINDSLIELVKTVNDMIKKGWSPIGGICTSDGKYIQAIIK